MFTKDQADKMLKSGHITPETHAKIMQKFAHGGKVKRFEEGGIVGAPDGDTTDEEKQQEPKASAPLAESVSVPAAAPMAAPAPTPPAIPSIEAQAALDLSNQSNPLFSAMAEKVGAPMPEAAPQTQVPQAAPTQPAVPPGLGMGAGEGFELPSEKMMKAAMFTQQKGVEEQAAAEQQALATAREQVQQNYQQSLARQKEIKARNDALAQDLASAKVDPDRMWNEKSTGGKIASILGILVSGIGSGMARQENLALKLLNQQIDRDIDAQKANITNKQNLFNRNLAELGEERTAEAQTRLDLLTAAEFKIKEAAAKAKVPQAQAATQAALGQIEMQKMNLKIQMGKMMSEAQSLGVTGGDAGIPIGKESYAMLTDPKYREVRVPLFDRGKVYQASSPQEGEKLRKVEASYQQALKLLNELNDLSGIMPKASFDKNARAKTIRKELPALLNSVNEYANFTEGHQAYLSELFSSGDLYDSLFAPNSSTNQTRKSMISQMEFRRAGALINYLPLTTYQKGLR